MIDNEGDDAFAGLVIPTQPVLSRAVRAFAPWHEPRKQWIRLFQWRDGVEQLIADVTFPVGGEILRYLGMPGEDMLDIRLIREVCERRGIDLHFTGVISAGGNADRDQLNVSETAIRRLPNIHDSSQIVVDRFEAIGQPTPTQTRVRQAGPYHVINADLTGHYAGKAPTGNGQTYVEALGEIIGLQIERARDPWLLFLTTRLDPRQTDAHNLGAFIRALRANIAGSPQFHDGMRELLVHGGEDLEAVLSNPEGMPSGTFRDLFCIGFGKWLLAYVQNGTPQQTVQMLESLYYSVHLENDMLSLAYLVTPVARRPEDVTGLLPARAHAVVPNEVELGIALLGATRGIRDLDGMLQADQGLVEQLIVESLILLRDANYPVDDNGAAYRSWLASRRQPGALAAALVPTA